MLTVSSNYKEVYVVPLHWQVLFCVSRAAERVLGATMFYKETYILFRDSIDAGIPQSGFL